DTSLRRVLRGPFLYLLVLLLGLWIFLSLVTRGPQATKLSLPQFESDLHAGRVATATFLERDQKVTGLLVGSAKYETTFPQAYEEALTREVLASPHRVRLTTDAQKGSALMGTL